MSPAAMHSAIMKANAIGLIAGPAAVLIVLVIATGWTGPDGLHMGLDALTVLIGATPLALAWLLAAIGFGWPLRAWLAPKASEPIALQVVLGIAAMLVIDSALGRLGFLQIGGSLGAWAIIVIGIAILVEQLRRSGITRDVELHAIKPHWLTWAAAPGIAVLLLATTSAPGWLWDTEYGGYDALSYHLQLPKEWLAHGAIAALEHNVYSFLPGAMEAAFYHVMVMRGDASGAAYACQLLHAMIAMVAAWVVGRVVVCVVDARATPQAAVVPAAAFVIVMGTPWVIVAGSLAYNEMPVLLMLAAGLLVIAERDADRARAGGMIGFFAGAACAAKLTAVGFVAAPLGVLMLMSFAKRDWMKSIAAALLGGAIALAPYGVGNSVTTGNPVFPFATGIFGTAHWSDEQATIWHRGHQSDLGVGGRMVEGWHQLLRFGIGPAPPHEERWHPQWSILPWLTILAIATLIARPPTRSWGVRLLVVIAIQIVFWLALTHVKSRFILPMVIPTAFATGLALASFPRRPESTRAARDRWIPAFAGMTALLLWSAVPVYVFAKQAGGAPAAGVGLAEKMTGQALRQSERKSFGLSDSPVIYLNHLLPVESRVLFVGEAAPFYYRGEFTYTTVWDRGPLSRLMREHPDDPRAWFDALRQAGYTHVLIDTVMLDRWAEAGWNDPLITSERVLHAARQHAKLENEWRGVVWLYRL